MAERWTHNLLAGAFLALMVAGLSGCEDQPAVQDARTRQPQHQSADVATSDTQVAQARRAADTGVQAPAVAPVELTPAQVERARAIFEQFRRTDEPLAIDHLLRLGDIRELTHFMGPLSVRPLEGQPPDAAYNNVRFSGDGHLGVALQVWQFSTTATASRFFARLRDTHLQPQDGPDDLGDNSFTSHLAGVRELVIVDSARLAVVSLSCDERLCPTQSEILRIAIRVMERL